MMTKAGCSGSSETSQWLLEAAKCGDLTKVRRLCQLGASPHFENFNGETPLITACSKGHLEVVKWLVKEMGGHGHHQRYEDGQQQQQQQNIIKQALVNVITKYGNKPLVAACASGKLEVLMWLVENAGSNITMRDGEKLLHVACKNQRFMVVQWLVDDLKVSTQRRNTPLHLACENGHLESVQWLIRKKGADIFKTNKDGKTSLTMACSNGHLEVLRWMVMEVGVDISDTDRYGRKLLHVASKNGRLPVVKWLIDEKHVQVDAANRDGNTPLHFASSCGHLNVVEWLVSAKGADVFALNEGGSTPLTMAKRNHTYAAKAVEYLKRIECLMNAIEEGELKEVQRLVKLGAHGVHCRTRCGLTPLFHACWKGHLELAQWLVQKTGVSTNVIDSDGNAPLHLACAGGHLGVVRWLVEDEHADINMSNNNLLTPFDAATANDRMHVAAWLEEHETSKRILATNAARLGRHRGAKTSNRSTDSSSRNISSSSAPTPYTRHASAAPAKAKSNPESISTFSSPTSVMQHPKMKQLQCNAEVGLAPAERQRSVDPVPFSADCGTTGSNEKTVETDTSPPPVEFITIRDNCGHFDSNSDVGSAGGVGTFTIDDVNERSVHTGEQLSEMGTILLNERKQICDSAAFLVSKKFGHRASAIFVAQCQGAISAVTARDYATIEEASEVDSIMNCTLHSEFYVHLRLKIRRMVLACEVLSSEMVRFDETDHFGYVQRFVQYGMRRTVREHAASFSMTGAKAAIEKSGLLVLSKLVTFDNKLDEMMAIARVGFFAARSVVEEGTHGVGIVIERTSRLIIRARRFHRRLHFGRDERALRRKELLERLLLGSRDLQTSAQRVADVVIVMLMNPERNTELARLFEGTEERPREVGAPKLHEVLAAAALGVPVDMVMDLPPFTDESVSVDSSHHDKHKDVRQPPDDSGENAGNPQMAMPEGRTAMPAVTSLKAQSGQRLRSEWDAVRRTCPPSVLLSPQQNHDGPHAATSKSSNEQLDNADEPLDNHQQQAPLTSRELDDLRARDVEKAERIRMLEEEIARSNKERAMLKQQIKGLENASRFSSRNARHSQDE